MTQYLTTQHLTFYMLALVTLVSAYRIVTARLITHAALWMALSFTAVSGVFLLLQQEFIAALQVLIYAGAITTMVLFAIMLSELREVRPGGKGGARVWLRASAPLAVVAGAVFAAFMSYVYYAAGLPDAKPMRPMEYPTVERIGEDLMTRFVVPFEIASILLLIAMIGAIILTAKEVE